MVYNKMLYFDITFIKERVIMNRRIEKKAADELIIVRLRCKFPIRCDGNCNRKVRNCNKEAMDITIKPNDLILEGPRRHKKVHFKNTLLKACERLRIDIEKVFCDKHKEVANENYNCITNITIPNGDTDKNIS